MSSQHKDPSDKSDLGYALAGAFHMLHQIVFHATYVAWLGRN
jgi:hypothetical protein